MLRLYDLTVEYRHEPVGLDCAAPRFSWKLESDQQDTCQKSFVLMVNGETIAAERSSQSMETLSVARPSICGHLQRKFCEMTV